MKLHKQKSSQITKFPDIKLRQITAQKSKRLASVSLRTNSKQTLATDLGKTGLTVNRKMKLLEFYIMCLLTLPGKLKEKQKHK